MSTTNTNTNTINNNTQVFFGPMTKHNTLIIFLKNINKFINKIKYIIIHFLYENPIQIIPIEALVKELKGLNNIIAKFNTNELSKKLEYLKDSGDLPITQLNKKKILTDTKTKTNSKTKKRAKILQRQSQRQNKKNKSKKNNAI